MINYRGAGSRTHGLVANGEVVQTFEPQLTALQLRVLKLLGLSPSIYARPPV